MSAMESFEQVTMTGSRLAQPYLEAVMHRSSEAELSQKLVGAPIEKASACTLEERHS